MSTTTDRDPYDFEIDESFHSLLPIRSSQLPAPAEPTPEEPPRTFTGYLWQYLGGRRR